MQVLKCIRRLFRRRSSPAPGQWFHVSCEDDAAKLDVAPPSGQPWRASIKWTSITKVCFKAKDLWVSDIYIHTSDGEPPFVIPADAEGADALWDQLRAREIIDSDFATLALAAEKGIHCHPPDADGAEDDRI